MTDLPGLDLERFAAWFERDPPGRDQRGRCAGS